MIQIAPQMRILVAVEAVDFRNGIDGLARVCKQRLKADPFSGWLFVFRNRRSTAKSWSMTGKGFGYARSGSRRAGSVSGRPVRRR